MGTALFILGFACVCGMWYTSGRNSIYLKLKEDYCEALKLIGLQQAIIEAYKRKYESKKRRKKMEKINIAEILRDYPKGTKLYSPLFGKCELAAIGRDDDSDNILIAYECDNTKKYETFSPEGRFFSWLKDVECLLFPSSEMRSWDKFFKRGDVLVCKDFEEVVVFEGWKNEDYTKFSTTINFYKERNFCSEGEICLTDCFVKATDKQRVEFIEAAEKHYGGKYNPETLQVEPIKVAEPKCPFEPFQKVLVRDDEDGVWKAGYFSNYDEDDNQLPYICVGSLYKLCIPYEGNEHLLGTNKSPE